MKTTLRLCLLAALASLPAGSARAIDLPDTAECRAGLLTADAVRKCADQYMAAIARSRCTDAERPKWDTRDPAPPSCIPGMAPYPKIKTRDAYAFKTAEGWSTVREVQIDSVLRPNILIVEVFARPRPDCDKAAVDGCVARITGWQVEALSINRVDRADDVVSPTTKSTAISLPYGVYRVTVTTERRDVVDFNFRFE